ncbi:MAG TPA: 50S ribosomal protein L10 [Thermoguttaceae bacterium]|nr:50S ribosomal protein L10 [Thermoguttaceae bacterium]
MSKYVKNLIAEDLRGRLEGVNDALVVDVIGMDGNANNRLRGELESKDIHLLVVKNSMARRATASSSLAPMFEGVSGTAAICWGGEDIVSLAKEITRLAEKGEFPAFKARGGVMDGEAMTASDVAAVSKWPNRHEQLSLLVGQILGPGAKLAAQLLGPGGALASQIEQKAGEEGAAEGETADAVTPA